MLHAETLGWLVIVPGTSKPIPRPRRACPFSVLLASWRLIPFPTPKASVDLVVVVRVDLLAAGAEGDVFAELLAEAVHVEDIQGEPGLLAAHDLRDEAA